MIFYILFYAIIILFFICFNFMFLSSFLVVAHKPPGVSDDLPQRRLHGAADEPEAS